MGVGALVALQRVDVATLEVGMTLFDVYKTFW